MIGMQGPIKAGGLALALGMHAEGVHWGALGLGMHAEGVHWIGECTPKACTGLHWDWEFMLKACTRAIHGVYNCQLSTCNEHVLS